MARVGDVYLTLGSVNAGWARWGTGVPWRLPAPSEGEAMGWARRCPFS